MGTPVKVFFTEPVARFAISLRCYDGADCPTAEQTGWSYHNTEVRIEDDIAIQDSVVHGVQYFKPGKGIRVDTYRDDPRWPTQCACGFRYEPHHRQIFSDRIYRSIQDGREWPRRQLPVGAMYDAYWGRRKGPDGISLQVVTPGGDWNVDARASNCTLPNDQEHYCWVRHGDPRTGNVHVDKQGHTCAAGAGSIMCGGYHGFLHSGFLTEC